MIVFEWLEIISKLASSEQVVITLLVVLAFLLYGIALALGQALKNIPKYTAAVLLGFMYYFTVIFFALFRIPYDKNKLKNYAQDILDDDITEKSEESSNETDIKQRIFTKVINFKSKGD